MHFYTINELVLMTNLMKEEIKELIKRKRKHNIINCRHYGQLFYRENNIIKN